MGLWQGPGFIKVIKTWAKAFIKPASVLCHLEDTGWGWGAGQWDTTPDCFFTTARVVI